MRFHSLGGGDFDNSIFDLPLFTKLRRSLNFSKRRQYAGILCPHQRFSLFLVRHARRTSFSLLRLCLIQSFITLSSPGCRPHIPSRRGLACVLPPPPPSSRRAVVCVTALVSSGLALLPLQLLLPLPWGRVAFLSAHPRSRTRGRWWIPQATRGAWVACGRGWTSRTASGQPPHLAFRRSQHTPTQQQ